MISDYFTEKDIITQLKLQFDYEEMFDADFENFFNQIIERENDFFFKFRGRKFSIDKITGIVEEV